MTISSKDPKSLKRHPLHKAHVPSPDKETPEWKAFSDAVHADGRIKVPLFVTPAGFVTDGWWRREAAVDWNLGEVPVAIHDDAEAAIDLVEGLTARKQMTRGAAVYLAIGLITEYARACENRRHRNQISKRTTNEQRIDPKGLLIGTDHTSCRYLAERLGCGANTVVQARLVRSHLHDLKIFSAWLKSLEVKAPADRHAQMQEGLRAEIEPLLFNGEKSLWTVLQAAAGRLTTKDQPKRPGADAVEQLAEGLSKVFKRALALEEADDAGPAILHVVSAISAEEELERIEAIGLALQRAAQRRAKELTAGVAS